MKSIEKQMGHPNFGIIDNITAQIAVKLITGDFL
jgi:hypothetical protein